MYGRARKYIGRNKYVRGVIGVSKFKDKID